MRLVILILSSLLSSCLAFKFWDFQIQPQLVRINNDEKSYITNDEHYIGQVLYRYDRIELGCECQTLIKETNFSIYWLINNQIDDSFNNSSSIQLNINNQTVRAPKTSVTCYCLFFPRKAMTIQRDYQYQLYIDFESDPSLKPVIFKIEPNFLKQRFYDFLQRHSFVIFIFLFLITGTTCPLIIYSFVY